MRGARLRPGERRNRDAAAGEPDGAARRGVPAGLGGQRAAQSVDLRSAPIADRRLASLTQRQAAVAEALRHGKSNKIIAYELNMCENTVKVHIRSILKKLHATNRTEAAFRLNSVALGGAEPLTL